MYVGDIYCRALFMNNKIVIEVFVAINNSRCRYPKHERSASTLLARANVTAAGTWNAVLMTAALVCKANGCRSDCLEGSCSAFGLAVVGQFVPRSQACHRFGLAVQRLSQEIEDQEAVNKAAGHQSKC